MRLITLIICFTLNMLPISAIAGSDHDHGHSHSNTPVTQATAVVNAEKIVAALAEKNTLDKSWAAIPVSTVEERSIKGNSEWVAIFINNTITDADKRTLYVFMTLGGEYIAANYTGK